MTPAPALAYALQGIGKKLFCESASFMLLEPRRRALASSAQVPRILSAQTIPVHSREDVSSGRSSLRHRLQVRWSDGSSDSYPLAWLRDMCQCSQCAHASVAASRLLPFAELAKWTGAVLSQVKKCDEGKAVLCRWSDGHESIFDIDWLQGPGCLRPDVRRQRRADLLLSGRHRVPWQRISGKAAPLASVSFDELVSSDASWIKFVLQLRHSGVHLIKAAPRHGLCKELVRQRQLLVRETNYGPFWTVDVRANPHDLAFTNAPLEPHSDLLFYSRPPQVIWFHCLKQATVGGDTILCDGLAAANQLRLTSPSAFTVLARVPVDHQAIGEDSKGYGAYRFAYRTPVIKLDEYGDVDEILWNSTHRSYMSCTSAEDLEEWYDAAAEFHLILNGPDFKISHRLEAGDLLVVDNLRVMHGRSSFSLGNKDAQNDDEKIDHMPGRLIEGFYTDWDDMLSSYRAIEHRSKQPSF